MTIQRKHSHYFKDVGGLSEVDVYRVLRLFDVHDHAIAHAIKKLLVCGERGFKDAARDVQEAIDTLQRWQEMEREDANPPAKWGNPMQFEPQVQQQPAGLDIEVFSEEMDC